MFNIIVKLHWMLIQCCRLGTKSCRLRYWQYWWQSYLIKKYFNICSNNTYILSLNCQHVLSIVSAFTDPQNLFVVLINISGKMLNMESHCIEIEAPPICIVIRIMKFLEYRNTYRLWFKCIVATLCLALSFCMKLYNAFVIA